MLFKNPEIERAADRYSNLQAASAVWMATQKIIKIKRETCDGGEANGGETHKELNF